MNQPLLQLLQLLRSLPIRSPEWEETCSAFIDHILKRRHICRVRQGVPLDGVYLEILNAMRQHLRSLIEYDCTHQKLGYPTLNQWRLSKLTTASREALTEERLQYLAISVQSHVPRTVEWQNALTELITALNISNCLTKQSSLNLRLSVPLTQDDYQDVKHQTLIWIAERIQTYSPEKCSFIAWVNERLKWIAIERHQTTRDPLVKRSGRKVRSLKSSLKASLERTNLDSVLNWLGLYLRKLIPVEAIATHVLCLLSGMMSLWVSLQHHYTQHDVDQILYDTVVQIVEHPTTVINFGDQVSQNEENDTGRNWQLDQIANTPQPSMELLIRRCLLRSDQEADVFDQHIRNHPKATFRAITLAFLDDQKFQDIAASFNIENHSTVSNFFYRRLKRFAPLLKELVEDEFALWRLQHPDTDSI